MVTSKYFILYYCDYVFMQIVIDVMREMGEASTEAHIEAKYKRIVNNVYRFDLYFSIDVVVPSNIPSLIDFFTGFTMLNVLNLSYISSLFLAISHPL